MTCVATRSGSGQLVLQVLLTGASRACRWESDDPVAEIPGAAGGKMIGILVFQTVEHA